MASYTTARLPPQNLLPDSFQELSTALADRYRLERTLGEGGMATVYLAEDLKHARKVAVKVLKPELAAVLGAERFLAEIKVTANLQHPNLLPLFDSGEAGGFLYYVMPFMDGEALRARLDRERQLPVDDVVRLTTLLAGALDYAHAQGVIHRDLKPENILLQAGQPVIADFGIALAVAQAGGSRVTETGLSLGTPHYMSPEQAAGERNLDAKSDQYALAAVTYEMLSGEPPHTGPTAQAIIARLMTETPRSLRATRPAVSPAVDAAVQRALSKTPADRFPTCGAFTRALAAAPDRAPAASVVGRLARAQSIIGVVMVVVLLGAVAFEFYPRGPRSMDSIAVLPFDIRSSDPDGDYISDGITQSISVSLTRLPGLRVIPVSVGREYKAKGMTSQQVGEELGIAAVLTGRVTQRGDSVGVDVELADIQQGKLLWGERFNRRLADLLAIQDEISAEVSRRLISLSSTDQQQLRRGSTENPEAYQLYLKGMYFTAKFTLEGFDRGRGFFQQALALDSSYAMAWDGLAWNYITAGDWFIPPREAGPKAKAAAGKALAIDSTLASAHLSLALVAHWYDWDWPAAEQAFRRTIAMDSTNARPRDYYAWFLVSMRRYDEAVAEAERAQRLDPVSAEASQMLGMVLVLAQRYDQAITQLRGALELDPNYFYAEDFLGRAYEQTRRMPEALAAYQRAVELDPNNAENWSNLGHALAVSGNPARARQIIADLKATAARTYVGPYNIALIYAGLGDSDEAFAWLQRACEDGQALPILYMGNDARWDRFRSDGRYAEIARCLRLPPFLGNP